MRGDESNSRVLLYGAYGYTGRLAAELAVAKKLDVVLAGRNRDALAALGERLSLPTRVVGLNDPKGLSEALKDIACVVHMAGPFAVTSAPILDACLATQTNYIDITGEIEVFEAMWSREDEIKRAGITVVPGAGFDVVPSDCLAGYVASKLEQPASLVSRCVGWKAHLKVRCAPPFAKFPNLYCPGGRDQSLSSTTDRHAGSISALAMSHVFLSHGATLPLHFTALA
jgi:short subunit dehydrogenase-like uncharacterized protein